MIGYWRDGVRSRLEDFLDTLVVKGAEQIELPKTL